MRVPVDAPDDPGGEQEHTQEEIEGDFQNGLLDLGPSHEVAHQQEERDDDGGDQDAAHEEVGVGRGVHADAAAPQDPEGDHHEDYLGQLEDPGHTLEVVAVEAHLSLGLCALLPLFLFFLCFLFLPVPLTVSEAVLPLSLAPRHCHFICKMQ